MVYPGTKMVYPGTKMVYPGRKMVYPGRKISVFLNSNFIPFTDYKFVEKQIKKFRTVR